MAEAPTMDQLSPFLHRSNRTELNSLTILHLKRDLQVPTLLRSEDENNEGYDEGKVTNTRFGSFPHSTLIGLPWGSQVRASDVDTGSRGRRGANGGAPQGKKRKRSMETADGCSRTEGLVEDKPQKAAVVASTGFAYVLPPTPESWTSSLPHRTQVVYTPDYSYILQRIRARPGTILIEAGAGSGSFTHAAARAVFNGYPQPQADPVADTGSPKKTGKVWSFEFHAQRATQLRTELKDHGLDSIVAVNHRDVYTDGFSILSPQTETASTTSSLFSSTPHQLVRATSVFLDLPAPWLALEHLTRATPHTPLDPSAAVRICTFSPCIEQVQRTVSTLRNHGWLEISMVEIAARRLEFRRERVGLQEEGLRGVNATAATVEEALERLRELERRAEVYHAEAVEAGKGTEERKERDEGMGPPVSTRGASKQDRLRRIRDAQAQRKLHVEGRLVSRSEPELKMHTSYLVFAVLPREWGEEDEAAAIAGIGTTTGGGGSGAWGDQGKRKSRRQAKREARAAALQ